MKVTFLYPHERHIRNIEEIDIDDDHDFFNVGERVWTVQTYLRLKQAGYDVGLSTSIPSDGVVVFHRHSLDYVKEHHSWTSNACLVCIRADQSPTPEADFEVVQNRHSADGERTHFIPHWPQPGLEPRNPERGTSVEVLSYKGNSAHLHDSFKSERWQRFVQRHDLVWRADSIKWKGRDHFHNHLPWKDYCDVDIIIALRSDLSHHYPSKPASKLINAWMAGVPAILGPEVAYQELRESPLDYIEACSLDDVIDGVKRLKEDDEMYKKMVKNGKNRSRNFANQKIVKKWANFLLEKVDPNKSPNRIIPMYYRINVKPQKLYNYLEKKLFKK